MIRYILIIIILTFFATSCINWKGIGEDVTKGAVTGLKGNDSLFSAIAGSITKGAIDSIKLDKLSQEANRLIDEIFENLGKKADTEIIAKIDSVLGDVLQSRLKEIGALTSKTLATIRDELLGSKTLNHLLALRNQLLGDSTVKLAAAFRDELLGENTSILVSKILSASLDTIEARYKKLQPEFSEDLRKEQEQLKSTITTILWVAGGIVAGLIVLCFILNYKRSKYLKLNELLTQEIQFIPEQMSYDELTKRIQKSAQDKKLEKDLRKILTAKGLLGSENWKG